MAILTILNPWKDYEKDSIGDQRKIETGENISGSTLQRNYWSKDNL